MEHQNLRQAISVIIALDRWDTSIISEEIADKIIDKFIQSGWTYTK